MVLLISPVCSLTCTSQKLTGNKLYSNCTDLPQLDAYLHWTYNASNSSLSVAFIAAPAGKNGWVAWAINPTAEGMAGSQALVALKSGGSVVLKTFNISSYSSIVESKLSFEVWDTRAEEKDGKITIFATVKVPEKAEKVNQVWQVGPSVTNGKPDKHEFKPPNLASKGSLKLVETSAGSTTNGTSSNSNSTGSGDNKSGASRIGENFGLGLGLVMFLLSIFRF
ncbi:Cytochrome b561 and DOMON domain-containing protein [Quillaja saponaria]|uniref:Cytochrome b561 and DOMON domain-containing protein n=1 Tax=Quillaja saponaria TaxID=32244 RepID=A0AAD7LNX5_QUISA|nr:Cytochrome b561 and DOMON domain-containing protein [Quillaja saponaria]